MTLAYLLIKDEEFVGWILAQMAGGMEMILGYYLYEQVVLGYYALAEVPFNVMQVLIGILVATNVFKVIGKRSMGVPS